MKYADCIILDTNAHINFFKKLFPLKKAAYERVFVGADDSKAFPKKIIKKWDKFVVFFYGTYIPLHGIEYILKAAKELENHKEIIFTLVGGGQNFAAIQNLAKNLKLSNVRFIPPVSYSKLIDYMNLADICLGIFGTSKKSENVIPNKIFDALAVGKPLITRDSVAIREALKNEENAILCKAGNGKSLADAILLLKNDENLMKKIATNNYLLFQKKFTPKQIGNSLLKIIEKYI
ncbi:MAG TPA: glycosyltransferase [Candidatus Deferrimicrobium sp.]|nr:glycosyltransferase [Candidatus Deferrimicrobium sp.]